jgi:hypothetical protein
MRARLLTAALAAALMAAAAPALAALPQVDYSLAGTAGNADWFVGPVTVKWTMSGEQHADAGCLTQTLTADTPGVQLSCTVSNASGPVTGTTNVIKIDRTPPTAIAAAPARPPDHGSWYTAPLAIGWTGNDATSGIGACTSLVYAGPDGPAVAPSGTCRDGAGNVGTSVPFGLAYDTTAPTLTDVTATLTGTTATVRWSPAADVAQVSVARRPGDAAAPARALLDGAAGTTREATDGPLAPGAAYTWTITAADAAGNAAVATATATVPPATAAASVNHRRAKKAAALRALRWRARPGAEYYNLQLFRNGRKILSAWPTTNHYTLRTGWTYRGHRHHLVAGRYRWYAWAGYGARSRHRYGTKPARGVVRMP